MDEDWIEELDIRAFMDTLCLPYQEEEIEEILDCEDADDFLIRFQNLTNLPFFISDKYKDLSDYLRLDKSSKWVNVYTKNKNFRFSEEGAIE